jgi:integrase/recombinase XerC
MPQVPVRLSAQRRRGPSAAHAPHRPAADTGVIGWDDAVSRFLAEARRRNRSASTVENYGQYLAGGRIKAFLADQRIETPSDLGPEQLKALEGELLAVGLSSGTVDTYHRIIKNFLGTCVREGWGGDAGVLTVKGPKLEQREPETFTHAEEKQLKAHLSRRFRDLMIVELMLATGLRLQEICNLTVDDIIDSPGGALIRVRQGKGRKDRAVPLDTPANKVTGKLRRYIDHSRPRGTGQSTLFLGERRDRGDHQPLTPHAIQTMMTRITRETGIHVNPHKFRHTFSTRALAAGVDVMALQKALGHTTLAMVSRYLHYQQGDLTDTWNRRRD